MKNSRFVISLVTLVAATLASSQIRGYDGYVIVDPWWENNEPAPPAMKTIDLKKDSKKLRVVVEIPPNKQIRLFHVDRKICNTQISEVGRDLIGEKIFGDVGPICRKIAKRLYAINGVAGLTFQPYSVYVETGKAFRWEEVEGKVVAALLEVVLEADQDTNSYRTSLAAKGVPVFVNRTGNPSCRLFSTRKLLSRVEISHLYHPINAGNWQNDELLEIGSPGSAIAKKLVSIRGVEEVFIKPYEVTVVIGQAFTWEEIQPKIVAVFQNEIAKHPVGRLAA